FVYGFVVQLAGNAGFDLVMANKLALLSVLGFFVVALLLLIKVRQPVMGESKTEVWLEDDLSA
ncbi:MAG: hypothetical protein ACXAAQ_17015, partial [Candidatus Thorarchaeota archaeon]